LTGGGGAGNESLWRQWHGSHELYFGDAAADVFAPCIPPQRRVQIPFATDPTFVPSMQRICSQLAIDVLIPGVDEELLPLANQHGSPAWPRVLLPQASFVATMLDKLTSMHAVRAAGLAAPHTIQLSDVEELDRMAFPLIVKPRSGRGSRGVMPLERRDQVEAYLRLHGMKAERVVAQQLVAGQEYTVFVYADNRGHLRAVVPVRVLHKRGITIRARTEAQPAIVSYVSKLHEALRPTGPYNMQCMLTAQGEVMPFEVNPRISTTFCLALAAGADPLSLDAGPAAAAPWTPRHEWTLQRTWHNDIGASNAIV
jgi:carbamoyl-phosphate synthase large subunit